MNANTNTLPDGRKITTVEICRLNDRDRADRLAASLRGYMIDRVVVAPYMGGFHVSIESMHEDAPEQLVGFALSVLASAVARS